MVTYEQFLQHLSILPGITAIIGGGGKTSLLLYLASVLQKRASVLLATSTHIYPPDNYPFRLRIDEPIAKGTCITVGAPSQGGKITAPQQDFASLRGYADYLIVEADGAKGRPLKAHAAHEPVIPGGSGTVIAVIGADGIGQTVSEAAHRPELYAEKLGIGLDTVVTPMLAAAMIKRYPLVTGVVVNKADSVLRLNAARETAALLPFPCAITAFHSEQKLVELWRNGTCLLL